MVDGFKNYICKPDAITIILYSWIGILLRNYYYCQEVQQWNIRHNPLFVGEKEVAATMIKGEDGQLVTSPFSIVPKLSSGRFAIIVLVILNNLNRYEKGLITKSSYDGDNKLIMIWNRLKRVNIIVFDAIRCLLKNFIVSAMINGPNL